MTKICHKCNFDKDELDFSPAQFRKPGGWCRACISISKKVYYQDNKAQVIQRSKNYQSLHKDEVLLYKKEYYIENKDDKLAYNKTYYENNRDQIIASAKRYNEEHKGARASYIKEYQKVRRKADPIFRLRTAFSTVIGASLKKNNSTKGGRSILKFLPYSMQELKEHLEKQFEPWMTWNNHGKYNVKSWNDLDHSTWTWNIDHIIPHSNFVYASMTDQAFKDCWALSNLRPLSAKQNIIDGDRK